MCIACSIGSQLWCWGREKGNSSHLSISITTRASTILSKYDPSKWTGRDVPAEVCQCKHLFCILSIEVSGRAGSMFNVLKFQNLGWGSMMVYSKAGTGRQIASLHDSYIFHMLRLRPIEIRSSLSPPTMSVQVMYCCARANAIWHRARLPDFFHTNR